MSESLPFWRRKTLAQMSRAEWESLCDGCGRCCLVKLEEEAPEGTVPGDAQERGQEGAQEGGQGDAQDNPPVYFTDVGCRLLDGHTCRCRDYRNRQAKVPDCLRLTPQVVAEIGWLPPTCAYRLLDEGRDLYWWHPLVSGDPETVHQAGVSVRGRLACSEDDVAPEDLEDHIVSWPLTVPRRARAKRRRRVTA